MTPTAKSKQASEKSTGIVALTAGAIVLVTGNFLIGSHLLLMGLCEYTVGKDGLITKIVSFGGFIGIVGFYAFALFSNPDSTAAIWVKDNWLFLLIYGLAFALFCWFGWTAPGENRKL